MKGFEYQFRVRQELRDWQTTTAPGLIAATPEALFTREFADTYINRHRDIWWRLTQLHGTLFSLEMLEQFPFRYIYAPDEMHFWKLVVDNFLDHALVLFTNLTIDGGQDANTIPRLRDDIIRAAWSDESMKDALFESLRQCRFDGAILDIQSRVQAIRNYRIAHRVLNLLLRA